MGRILTERRLVAAVSLVALGLLFFEYLLPRARSHMFADIEGFHFPLLNYASQALREGRLPLWDSSMYCGIPFAGNIQAALFYPPNWLLFLVNLPRWQLSYKSVEALVFVHAWVAFLLCYLWFRAKPLQPLASILGGMAYALTGYFFSQGHHVGVVTGYVWTPLALWGIDEAAARRSWRPMWKVVAASALCFLAGYPATWVVFAACVVTYAVSTLSWRTVAASIAALAASLVLAAVQLLPTAEAAGLKTWDPKYGAGVRELEFFAALMVPNYFDLGSNIFGWGLPTGTYLYLGAPALFGVLWLARGRFTRMHVQALLIVAVCLVGACNPFLLISTLLERSRLLIQSVHSYNFLEGLPLAAAILAALAAEDVLKGGRRAAPRWMAPLLIALLGLWSARQLWVWIPGGADFPSRWRNALEAGLMLALYAAALFVLRASTGARRFWLAAALLAAIVADHKVYGTSRGFNRQPGDLDDWFERGGLRGVEPSVYHRMRAQPEYRVALDENGSPHPTDMRHFGLVTPQGFDPLLPAQYKAVIERKVPFRTDRLFYLDPADDATLDLLAVRWFLTTESGRSYAALSSDPDFVALSSPDSYYRVFEYRRARPAFRSAPPGACAVERAAWTPERRELRLDCMTAARLVLIEQHYPGWRARIDGREIPIERWEGAFQAIQAPAGRHLAAFEYRPASLRIGAAISALSLLVLAFLLRPRHTSSEPRP